MTGADDIVAMLRREYDYFNNDGVGDYEVITTAADEIERLRSEKRQIQAELALAQKWRDNYKLAFDNSQKSCKYWHEKANSTNG